nr:MAG TPA: holin [Bacteriophage sp.]
MKNTNISAGTIARTIVLIVALVNTLFTAFGKNPLPFSDEEVYAGVSAVITVVVSLVAWWKNNSFTKKAIEADAILIESKTESEE